MSKRPHEAATANNPSPSKRNRIHQSEWGLGEVLAECGCLLRASLDGDEDKPNIDVGCQLEPRVTPSTLCSSLNALLNEMATGVDPNNTKILDSLEETLSNSLDDTENSVGDNLLRKMLLPMYRNKSEILASQMSQMSQSPSINTSGIKMEPYSLIQVLLRIDLLQSRLLTTLIQLLPEIATRYQSGECTLEDVPRLIFQNVRWLNHIIDGASLTTCFGECLSVLASNSCECSKTRGILLDAIATLPDLLNGTFGGGEILPTLQMLREEDPTLLIPCLDAIDSMPLSCDQVETVMNDALVALVNAESWGLPALTSFLINNCPRGSGLAKEVIEEFRKLPLGSMDYEGDGGSGNDNPGDTEALMIEALSRGFAHRLDLTSTLLKCVKDTAQGYHKPADVWLLACCASASHNRAQVKSVFRSKANDGGFTPQIVRDAIKGNGVALTSLFGTSLCDLADSLLRSSDNEVCELGVTLYEVLFEEFKEPMQRQEVVGSLVVHVGSGVGSKQKEVDAAMRTFSSIIAKKDNNGKDSGAAALRPFTPFLTSLLEHLLRMTPSQVRKLFTLLFTVGIENNSAQDGGPCTEASIIIKKYLGIHDYSKLQIGIIGTISYAVSMSAHVLNEQGGSNANVVEQNSAAAGTNDNPVVKDIKEMIKFALDNCEPRKGAENNRDTRSLGSSFNDGQGMSFLLKELGYAVRSGKLLRPICQWLDDHFQEDLEEKFISDFVGESTQELEKSDYENRGETQQPLIPTSSEDLAILNSTSENKLAPPRGEMRFSLMNSMQEPRAFIYINILSLLTSPCVVKREVLPVQLCSQFSLMATLNDARYGGRGLGEIDALLEAPIFLPSSECSGVEFTDLSTCQQWVTTSSYYFATCWVRELINAFIHAEQDRPTSASSQGFQVDPKKRVVERLRNLVELEEELRFTSSKCYNFAPPGLDVLLPPKELYENDNNEDTSSDVFRDVDPNNLSDKASKKANKEAAKLAAKLAKQKAKSKQKRLSARSKFEKTLADRSLAQIRPLDPAVCIALGYDELRPITKSNMKGSQLSALALSQLTSQEYSLPKQETLLLLNVLDETLRRLLSNKQGLPFKTGSDTKQSEESLDVNSNPYGIDQAANSLSKSSDVLLVACDSSQKECFEMFSMFLNGGVFSAVFEHLTNLAMIRCAEGDIHVDGSEERIFGTANILFSCISTILGSNKLTRSTTGKSFLAAILKTLEGTQHSGPIRQVPVTDMVKMLNNLFDLIKEILTGDHTDDMEFVMNGVSCLAIIMDCSQRLEKGQPDENGGSKEIGKKLSDVTNTLLKRGWPDDAKLNKSNVGKMLSLLLEHSYTAIPSNTSEAVKTDLESLGRMSTLKLLVNDVLCELPNTDKCRGPVDLFQTCNSQTFGCYFSTVLSYVQKELSLLFESSLGKTKDPSEAKKTLEYVTELVHMVQNLFGLTMNNEALAKKHALLQQLKWGSRFLEIFVKAIPFLHTHFQDHQDAISIIIGDVQRVSRQMYHIIAYGKRVKDANLAKETPRSKKALELFMHKVKALLKKNRCLTAMWTKKLKSKDIDGSVLKDDDESNNSDDHSDNDEESSVDANSACSSEGEYETDEQSVDE